MGDRYLTDVVFGNAHGMLTVRTRALTEVGDPLIVRALRALEARYVALLRRCGVAAPATRGASALLGAVRTAGSS